MGKPQRRFGKEFEAEAVRLVEVSGRTQREIAMDLGVGLSTLRRWLDKRREHEIEAPPPERQEDLAAELKRLRRENETVSSMRRRRNSPSSVSARFLASARAAILPGRIDRPAVGSMRTWCCWPIFARPLHCRTQPTAARA